MNIYIGNLHTNTSEAEVMRLFEKFGSVHAVKIIMNKDNGLSKGFGFVEMQEHDAGIKAIEALNNKNYMNLYLEVSEAMPDNSTSRKKRKITP